MRSNRGRFGRGGRSSCQALALAVAIATGLPQLGAAAEAQASSEIVVNFRIPSGDLTVALEQFSTQSGVQAMYRQDLTAAKRSNAVNGQYSPSAALTLLLKGTGITWVRVNETTFALQRSAVGEPRATERPVEKKPQQTKDEPTELAEILVVGSKSINADIVRTEDDIQPYVIFDREEIQGSFAGNLEEFLTQRLPMNSMRGTASRNDPGTTDGNRSSFNLRGLGSNQTLILINGRRAPSIQADRGTDLTQPDINGIPIDAVERIEVLPTTASGIYGGGATGGVINVILRKDYESTEIRFSYDNSFDTDSARRRLDISSGVSLEAGKTHVMLTASASDANSLLAGDRDFATRSREMAVRNDVASMEVNLPPSNLTNFRSVDGNPLTLLNGVSLGTTFGSVPRGYLGGDNGNGLLAGANTYDLTLPKGITGARQSLASAPETRALLVTARRDMGHDVEAYVDAAATENESSISYAGVAPVYVLYPGDLGNPFNNLIVFSIPAGSFEAVSKAKSETRTLTAGLIWRPWADWAISLEGAWNKSISSFDQIYAGYDKYAIEAAFASGALNPFVDTSLQPLDFAPYVDPTKQDFGPSEFDTKEYTVRAGGPAFNLPAGPVNVSGVLSARQEDANEIIERNGEGSYRYYAPRSQDITSIYLEAVAPILSGSEGAQWSNNMELQTSMRWDKYDLRSVPTGQYVTIPTPSSTIPEVTYQKRSLSSFDYLAGLKYEPIKGLAIRASYSTGFLPPSLDQIAPLVIEGGYVYVNDPKRGGEVTLVPARVIVAGNPNINPEQSKSISMGLIYEPEWLPGLRVSADYAHIKKSDEIVTLSQQAIVDLESEFPGRVTRSEPGPEDPSGYAGVINGIDTSVLNIASSSSQSYDFQIDYERYFSKGNWIKVYAVATYHDEFERQIATTSSMVDQVGFNDGPLAWKGNIGFVWSRGSVSIATNTQIYDGYKVYESTLPEEFRSPRIRLQGDADVSSQWYTDVSAKYDFVGGSLDGVQVSMGVKNIFDRSPPIIAGWQGTGGYSTYGDPRMRTYAVSIRKTF